MKTTNEQLLSLMEPEASNAPVDTLQRAVMAELAAVSTAISLKRIADVLTSDEPLPALMAGVNAYGENFAVAIQEGLVRGARGISQYE